MQEMEITGTGGLFLGGTVDQPLRQASGLAMHGKIGLGVSQNYWLRTTRGRVARNRGALGVRDLLAVQPSTLPR